MKNLVALSLLCIFLPAALHAQARTDRERDGLKGPVQSVRVRQTTIVTEDERRTESPLVLSHVISYDRAGSRTELALYDKSGALSRRITYTYDPGSKRLSELATYDAHDVLVRKVVDAYGGGGFKSSRAIYDYNEDGTFYRKTVLTFGPLGELIEVADYGEDGSVIKKESAPFKESTYPPAARRSSAAGEDRLIAFGSHPGEYFEPDARGNWTRGVTSSTSRTYSSGKKVKTEEVAYRELTYYQ